MAPPAPLPTPANHASPSSPGSTAKSPTTTTTAPAPPHTPPQGNPSSNAARKAAPVTLGFQSLHAYGKNFWLWELVSLVISVLSLVALAVVLAVYNNQPVGDGDIGITLNAIISVLVSVSEYALVYPVAEALSQQKWMRLQTPSKPQPLRGVQIYDEASRGPWGAFKLLRNGFAYGLVSIFGASIMVLHLFMGPFAQQIVSYPQRSAVVNASPADVPYVSRAQSYQVNVIGPRSDASIDFFQSATAGMENPFYHNGTLSNYRCRTGNCTWTPFTSLAICSTCVNVTDIVTSSCPPDRDQGSSIWKPCNVTMPGGFFVTDKQYSFSYAAVSGGIFSATSSYYGPLNASFSWNQTFAPIFGDLVYPILVTMVYESDPITAKTRVNTCALSYCLRTYFDVRVRNSVFNKGRVEDMIPVGPIKPQGLSIPKGGWELNPNDTYAQYSQNQSYIIGFTTSFSVHTLLDPLFAVPCPGKYNANASLNNTSASNNCTSSYLENALEYTWTRAKSTSVQLIGNLSESITNSIRNYGGFDGNTAQFAYGTESALLVFVEVEWTWLILPCVVVLLSTIFVLCTIIQNKIQKGHIWKSSSLALLYHGLAEVPDPAPDTLHSMLMHAETSSVHLEPTEKGSLRLRKP